jgi:hypothetical protein
MGDKTMRELPEELLDLIAGAGVLIADGVLVGD